MQKYYKGITEIEGTPIEEVDMQFRYDIVGFDPFKARILASCDSVMRIEYYVNKHTNKVITYYETFFVPYQTRYATVDQAVSFLLAEANCIGKQIVRNRRADNGRFAGENQIAYHAEIRPDLVVALKKLGLSISDISKILEISRTTVYSRIQAYNNK